MPILSLRIGVLIALLASPAFAETDSAVDTIDATYEPARGAAIVRLPFDPFTFESPPGLWDQLRDHRFWTAVAVEAVLATGLVQRDRANQLVRAGESLARRPELNYEFRVEQVPNARFRLQLKEVSGGPRIAIIVTW